MRAVDGALVLPEAPGTVWYDQSAPIGAPGASLIAGLETGAPVLVTDDEGEAHEYVVESLQVYEQQALPEDMLQSTGPDELVLVTCSGASISTGGAWSYEYNLVVTAPTV
ncbi:UNVERIFIED_CONTAM: class F sortase [Kocuria sp. CPCC 205295]|uniref:class F sortase n=1 Tax=Kocuria sp. CPCC 205295 TaxID=3073557 RepID=UPI0036DF6FDF